MLKTASEVLEQVAVYIRVTLVGFIGTSGFCLETETFYGFSSMTETYRGFASYFWSRCLY